MSEDEAEIIERASPVDFERTLERLASAIRNAGLTIFAGIHHAARAREAGLTLPRSTVLIYGHAKGDAPVMLAAPNAALDLPLRVLAREREDGRVVVVCHPVVSTLRRAGVPDSLAGRLAPAQQILVAVVAA